MSMAFAAVVPHQEQNGKMPDEATIGELAREFAVSLRTLRFYEDRGLLQPRRHGPSRFYSPADRRRLQTILKGKKFGFTLTEIKDLIATGQSGPDEADIEETLGDQQIIDQIHHLERQRDDIDAAIGRLSATRERRSHESSPQ
jgi:DNA-binding transcriptional MerR regulator